MNSMDYAYFHQHLEFFTHDSLKGRDTGSEGYDMAAQYVANEYKTNGLLPFGDNNTYFQQVELKQTSIDASSTSGNIKTGKGEISVIYGENISYLANPSKSHVNLNQDLVFVGYGAYSVKDTIDDYQGIDVKGKTVILVAGGPKDLPTEKRKHYNEFNKIKSAIAKKAGGIILIHPSKRIQKLVFKQMHSFFKEPMMGLADTSIAKSMFDMDIDMLAMAKYDLIDEVFKTNDLNLKKVLKSIKKGNNENLALGAKFQAQYKAKQEEILCKNVVGLLPGSDSVLKNEYVVLSAHLDHLGVGVPVKNDSIYNGMWDNATGSAAIVSTSKAYFDLGIQTKRSIIFVCLTGEEKGLFGSSYYAKKNNIENGKMVANLNIDMLGNLFETKDIIPMGYSHSNLSDAVDFGVKHVPFEIDDNKEEEELYLERSDQISFIENKVPALYIGTGYNAIDPKIDATKATERWMDKTYHSPQDDMNQEYSEKSFHDYLKLNFIVSYYISNEMDTIEWNKDNWLYKKYVLEVK